MMGFYIQQIAQNVLPRSFLLSTFSISLCTRTVQSGFVPHVRSWYKNFWEKWKNVERRKLRGDTFSVISLMCFYYLSKKISEQPCSNGEPEGIQCYGRNTDNSQTLRVPHGSRPHGHDRSLALCVNDPASWMSTPVLQSPP